jgi:Tfp pilus assembly protein PilF
VEAEQLLDKILEQNPKELGALVARGTARALRRELKGAEADFTAAIAIEPRCEGVLPVERVGSLGGA